MPPVPDSPRLDLRYQAPDGWFRATLAGDEPHLLVVMEGDGTDEGLDRLISFLDNAAALLRPGELVRVDVDVSGLTWVPLRTPVVLGRWILAERHLLASADILVGGPLVRTATEAVFRIAGVPNVRVRDR